MTQELLSHNDLHGFDRTGPADPELVSQVRHNAVRLLSEIGRTPRSLRLRAGEVAVEIDWGAEVQEDSAPTAVAQQPSAPAPAGYLTAPTVGIFYRAPEPGAAPFVAEGDAVRAGEQIGIVEAMKLMIPVEADRSGRIAEVLKNDGAAVEYGEPLFALAAGQEAS